MADQVVTLRIHADASGLVTGVSLAGKETRKLGEEGERAGQKMNSGMSAARRGVQSISTQLEQAKQAAIGFASAFASIQGARAIAAMADTWSDLTSRVSLNIDATESAADVMDRLADIARGTYSSLEQTAESFARNAVTLNALGKSTQEQLNYTEALNNALVVSGAKADAAAMVQDSLAKALAEGSLRGEELNNVLNRGSRVAELLAAELGTNVTELRTLGQQGAITGDVIYNTLVANMQVLKDEAASMPATIGDAFTLLRNSVLQTVGVFDQQSQISETMAEALIVVADSMDVIIKAAVGIAGALVAAHAAAAAATLVHEAATRRAAAAALAEAQAQLANLQAKGAGIATTAQLTAAENALAVAQTRAAAAGVAQAGVLAGLGKGLLALVGGPIGLAVAGLAALGYGMNAMHTRLTQGSESAREIGGTLEEMARKLDESTESALGLARGISDVERATKSTVDSAVAELEKQRAAVQRLREEQERTAKAHTGLGAGVGVRFGASPLAGLLEMEAQASIDAIEKSLDDLTQSLVLSVATAGDFGRAYEDAFKQLPQNSRWSEELAGKLEGLAIMFGRTAQESANAAAKVGDFGKEVNDYLGKVASRIAANNLNTEQLIRYNAALEAGKATTAEAGKAIMDMAEAEIASIRAKEGRTKAEQAAAAATSSATKAADDYIKKLREEVATAAMSAEQLERYERSKLNLTKEQEEEAERLSQTLRTLQEAWAALTAELEPAYDAVAELTRGSADLEEQLAQGRDVLAGLDDAQIRYNASVREANRLAMEALALGPMTAEQQAQLEQRLRLLAELRDQDRAIEQMQELGQEAARAAEDSARAWQDFTGSLADAVLDGSDGVKRWWKAMLDDMKRQLIQSGLLRLFGSLFNTGGGAGGFASMFGGMLGGGQAGGGFLGQLGNMFSGPAMSAAGSNFGAGIAQAAPWLAAAGGALYGYNQSGNIAGAVGYGALGYAGASVAGTALLAGGTAAAAGGTAAAVGTATMSGAMAGMAAVPVIGWIIAAIAALDMVTGGKVFGTSHRPESSASALNIGADGGFATASLTEVRQRSLFRGRSWRTTEQQASDEAIAAAEEFYASIYAAMTDAARALAADVPPVIDAAIRTVTEYDKKGRITGMTVSADVLGRTWSETIDDHEDEAQIQAAAQRAAMRIQAEAIIATIDAALGTTVQQAIGQALPGPIVGGVGDALDRVGRMIDAQIEDSIGGMGWAGPATGGAGGTMGEASAIAERWRHDAELLAAGAQFLLAAATDIRRGVGLLGEEGGLTAITALIEDLQGPSESLVDTYARVATSAALLDQALALSGVAIEGTREHIVRLASAITDAAGGLEAAQALWSSYFQNFYEAAELAQYNATQLRAAADAAFSGAGLDLSDYLDVGGLAQFRRDFEAAMPTLSAEDIAAWLRAADALAAVTASARAIDASIEDGAWQQYLDGLTDSQRAIEETTRYYDDWTAQLIASGATVEQLAAVEEQRAVAMGRVLAANAEAAAQEQARLEDAGQRYADFITGIWRETVQLSDYQSAMMDADSWRASAIATAHEHARAAGMAGASEQALALIELRASQLRAQALAQLREETQSLVDQLYGARGNDIGTAFTSGLESASNAAADYWESQRRSAETLQQYLDSMLLGDLSALTPAEQLAEAWSQLNDAVAGGDADAATRLADVYLRLLRGHEASGEDYNAGFWSVRELLQGMLDNIGPIPDAVPAGADGSSYITAAGAEQIAAQNRLDLAVQLAHHLDDLAGAVGQTVWELMDSMGVDLRQLTADLGISLQSITGETVLALVNMADLLGTDLLTLTGQLGVSLTDMGAGIRELAEQTGANLDALTVESVQALGGLANQLGIDLADIATSVGADLGSLADSQSLLNQALQGEIDKLPDDQARALQEYFDNIVAATSEADANEAIDTMAGYINSLDADIREELAPYFDKVFPAKALTDLDYLTQIASHGAAQLAAAQATNGLLARIADNAMSANNAAGIPSYAVGTYNVPATGPAILHAGEMVLPRPMADAMRQGAFGGGDTQALETRLDAVIARLDRIDKTTAQGAQAVSQAIITTGATSDRNADASRARHAQAQRRGVTA